MPEMTRREVLLSLPALALARGAFAQAATPPIRVKGINHVTLSVSDVKRSVDFYQGLFGMPVISRQGMTTNLRIGDGPQFLGVSAAGANPPNINHLCLGVDDFNVDRITAILAQRGIAKSDAAANAGGGLDRRTDVDARAPARTGSRRRPGGTPELYLRRSGRHRRSAAGRAILRRRGALGNVCPCPEPAPKKGLLALRDWSHLTNFVSDAARSNAFYQELFGLRDSSPSRADRSGARRRRRAIPDVRGRRRARRRQRRASARQHQSRLHEHGEVQSGRGSRRSRVTASSREATRTVAAGPMVHYISLRMENRGGAPGGTPELYFTDPDGLLHPASGCQLLRRWRRPWRSLRGLTPMRTTSTLIKASAKPYTYDVLNAEHAEHAENA